MVLAAAGVAAAGLAAAGVAAAGLAAAGVAAAGLAAAGVAAAGSSAAGVVEHKLPIMSFFVTWMTYLLINLMSMIKCVWWGFLGFFL